VEEAFKFASGKEQKSCFAAIDDRERATVAQCAVCWGKWAREEGGEWVPPRMGRCEWPDGFGGLAQVLFAWSGLI
jgi:hypothetical protein